MNFLACWSAEEIFFAMVLKKNGWELIKMIIVSKVIIIMKDNTSHSILEEMHAVLHECVVSLLMRANEQLFLLFFWLALKKRGNRVVLFARQL